MYRSGLEGAKKPEPALRSLFFELQTTSTKSGLLMWWVSNLRPAI